MAIEEPQRFNIALFPKSEEFITENVRLAQGNFASQAQEYLLGPDAWPHITLCQFELEPSRINQLWSSISFLARSPLFIHLAQFYIWLYEEHYWVGLGTKRESELIALQLSVLETLNDMGIKSNQTHSSYFPHITWARCKGDKPPMIKVLPQPDFWFAEHEFVLSLGASSPFGVYRKRLFFNDR